MARSSFHAWLAARPAAEARAAAEQDLAAQIKEIHAESLAAYGVPRVHAELCRRGVPVNRKKVERIMRERGIRGITRRRRRSLTRPDTWAAPAPDLIGRDFTSPRPGVRLVGDITYLATVIDLYSREVVGWSMAEHVSAGMVANAPTMAARRGSLAPDAVFHTDSEYVEYRMFPGLLTRTAIDSSVRWFQDVWCRDALAVS